MSICEMCHGRQERPTTHGAMTKEYFDVLIKALRHVAYRYGYALTVHGSLGMDIDLVAVPWRDSCCDQASVAEGIRTAAEAIIGCAEIREHDKPHTPTKKPCGRLAWSFYLGPEGCDVPYIDLSVICPPEEAK